MPSLLRTKVLLYLTKKLQDSRIPSFRDSVIPGFSFFLSNTFIYEPILLKLSMNANIVKMQIFHKIKSDLRGHSRSQIMILMIKNSPFLLFMLLLIDWLNAADHYEITKFDLYKDAICLFFTLTYILMDNFLSLFSITITSFKKIQVKIHEKKLY